MWHGGRIWFISDQGGTVNLWSMGPDGADRRRHTDHASWDARWPAMGPDGRVVYALAGGIQLFDPAAGTSAAVAVSLPSERARLRERVGHPERTMTGASLAPGGDRVAVETRGEIFSVPTGAGVVLPIATGSASREHSVSYSPDGARVVYVTDRSGEEAIVTKDAWGRGEEAIVSGPVERGWHHPPRWSPRGTWLAWSDDLHQLWVQEVAGPPKPRLIDTDPQSAITDYTFSPDDRWIAYTLRDSNDFGSVWVAEVATGERHRVTGEFTDDHSPAWDPDGRWLWFLGERTINPVLCARDAQYILERTTKPDLVLLRREASDPWAWDAGLPPTEPARGSKVKKRRGAEATEPVVRIDFDDLEARVLEARVEAGRYHSPAATSRGLFYVSSPVEGMVVEDRWRRRGPRDDLLFFDVEERAAVTFVRGVGDWQLAPGGDDVLVDRGRGRVFVVGAASPSDGPALDDGRVELSGILLDVDPRAESSQMFGEVWRRARDAVWDAGMSGVDWPAIRDQYGALLPRVSTRDDLEDLLGEMMGELATSHASTWGGDRARGVDEVDAGLLGADLVREGTAYRVERVLRGAPVDGIRSQLDRPGARVAEGEYIVQLNGRPFPPDQPLEAVLRGLADRRVVLTVNDRPRLEGAREVVVSLLGYDLTLRYIDWVRRNREHVARATGGQIGYVHIPDMGAEGLVAFERWFAPQAHLDGLVVDARWNGGGFVSQLIAERLRRRLGSVHRERGGRLATWPSRVLAGPFVVLTNQFALSDGDIFPGSVQGEGLAPVIGTRSVGAVVGAEGWRLVDGGVVTIPFSAFYGLGRGDGWTVENRGVEPDIEVQNLPQDVARGVDAQLDRAIEEVLRLATENPRWRPELEPPPDKSRGAFEGE